METYILITVRGMDITMSVDENVYGDPSCVWHNIFHMVERVT
jgi:hypothetical protein